MPSQMPLGLSIQSSLIARLLNIWFIEAPAQPVAGELVLASLLQASVTCSLHLGTPECRDSSRMARSLLSIRPPCTLQEPKVPELMFP